MPLAPAPPRRIDFANHNPATCRSIVLHPNGDDLRVEKFLDALPSPFSAHAAALEAPERQVAHDAQTAVDADRADAKPTRNTHGAFHVRRYDGPAQAILALIGDADGLC